MSKQDKKTWLDYGINLSNAQRTSKEGELRYRCPQCADKKGKSKNARDMTINTTEEMWHCFSCHWSGSLKGGVSRESNPLREGGRPSLPEIGKRKRSSFLNVSPLAKTPKAYEKPVDDGNYEIHNKVQEYLLSRKISYKTLLDAKISSGVRTLKGRKSLVVNFNYFFEGELVKIKYRDTKKNFGSTVNNLQVPYNIDSIKDEDECIITEGEIDVLSFLEAGYTNVISPPL